MKINLLYFICMTFIISCGFRHVKEVNESQNFVSGESDLTNEVSFVEVEKKIIGPKCMRCHSEAGGNQGGLNLETLESNLSHLESIKQRVLVDQNMPPQTPLSNREMSLLNNWITKELNSNPNSTHSIKNPILWPKIKEDLFSKHCFICHSPKSSMEADLDLTNLEMVRNKADIIFKRVVIVGDMPLRPYPSLSDQEKQWLSKWIIDGMLDVEAPSSQEQTQ